MRMIVGALVISGCSLAYAQSPLPIPQPPSVSADASECSRMSKLVAHIERVIEREAQTKATDLSAAGAILVAARIAHWDAMLSNNLFVMQAKGCPLPSDVWSPRWGENAAECVHQETMAMLGAGRGDIPPAAMNKVKAACEMTKWKPYPPPFKD